MGYYNHTAHKILQNEIGLILPVFPTDKRQKRGIIAKVLGSIASGVIGLKYEGIFKLPSSQKTQSSP